MRRTRALPRPFTMHWGGGHITEEAAFAGQHHEPAIQLLEYEDGEAAGTWSVRFCFYNTEGRFQRSPMMLSKADVQGLRAALRQTPRLRAILEQLLD